MRHIDRAAEPPILAKKKDAWLGEFIASGKDRPDSSKYANPQILNQLMGMSSCKCFYCECSLRGIRREVDHHIEISIDRDKAFCWENLYLACSSCNHKINEFSIPSTSTLDPCVDSDEEIKKHITFDAEQIIPVGLSKKGQKTIKKYHLDNEGIDYLRMKRLNKLHELIEDIDSGLIKAGRKDYTEEERAKLLSYTLHSQPFSYMCEVYLRKKRPSIFVP